MSAFFRPDSNRVKQRKRQIMKAKYFFTALVGLLLAICASNGQESTNSFVGIGVEVMAHHGTIRIIDVVPQSPAAGSQVKRGCYVEKVDGVSTKGMKLKQFMDLIRGPEGTTVTLELLDPANNTTNTVQLTREKITLPHQNITPRKTAPAAPVEN
jgi:C-terminal processing protease CtpA/Prc